MKNNIHKLLLCAIVVAIAAPTIAQNEVDALRYSLRETPYTARSLGSGGSFGAVGADLSNFFNNPAGLGMYKRGGMELSLGLTDQFAQSSYMGTSADNSKTHVNLNNFGLIGSQKSQNKNWPAFNFGVAYAKTNNFYENLTIKGTSESSLMTPFAIQANGTLPADLNDYFPFTAGIAYDAGAISPTDTTGQHYVPVSTGKIDQSKTIIRTGSQGETAIGFGTNFRDMIYFGMTVNFQSIRFVEKGSYSENYEASQPVSSILYKETLRSDGTGVNAKFGFLVKPSPWLRVGVAYHSPSRILLHETYSTEMRSTQASGSNAGLTYSSPDLISDYVVRTPSVLMANAAFIMGKIGIVSADYEYTNYERIRMRGSAANDYDYADENNVIGNIYRSTHKLRAGVELRLLSFYYLRTGAMFQQSPLVNEVGGINDPIITYTGGLGFRNDYFFVDLGMGFSKKQSNYYLYDPRFVQPANIKTNYNIGVLSIGYRF